MAVTNLENDIRVPLNVTVRKKSGGTNTPGPNVPGDDYDVSLIDWLNTQMGLSYSIPTTIVSIASTQTITGNKTFSGTSTFSGATTFSSTATFTGATAINGGLTMDTNKFIVADTSGNVTMAGTVTASNASINLTAIPTYANNAAAVSGGLAVGRVYQTAAGVLLIVV